MGCPIVHCEIAGRDLDRTKDFYCKLFDWQIDQQGPAAMIRTGSTEGIQGHFNALGHEPHHYVTVYVQVDDPQAYLDKAAKLGGKTLVPPTDIPNNKGRFAWLADPDGNIVGLYKPPAM